MVLSKRGASQYLLIALAIERMISLYQPFAVRLWTSKLNSLRLNSLLIIASLVIAAPVVYNHEIVENPVSDGSTRCYLIYRNT